MFKPTGYPDFTPYAIKQVDIEITGKQPIDAARANARRGLKTTPNGMTWHHVENTKTLQLIPTELHDAVRHTGGVANKKGKA